MGFVDTIYTNAPLAVQNAMISAYGWSWHRRRFGGVYKKEYHDCKERESYAKAQWDSYTQQQLTKMLVHAFTTVPYYAETWKQRGLTLEKIKSLTPDMLHQLPFLEKDDLRKFGKTTLLSNTREPGGKFFASSGTTGTPTNILFSEAMHQRWSALFEARIRNWAGLSRFDRRGTIGGRRIIKTAEASPPFYRYNSVEKQVYFSAYHISRNTAADYLEGIKKYKLDYMTGYAVSNYILARFIGELKLSAPELKAVITSSEKLSAEMRMLFQKVYGCKTYDSYSGLEACGLVSECEHGGMHISPDAGHLEFINDKGQPAVPGELAEVVCTGFLNYDQPLIRYRIGDIMILDGKVCACGREMPLVKEIIGRQEDIIMGKDGRQMVRFHGIFIDLPNIKQGQVIQESYDDYTIKVVADRPISENDKQTIRQRMMSQLGNDITARIEDVDVIPVGPNGKFKAVISLVKKHD
jgi:phenylacetate-CoA ligase